MKNKLIDAKDFLERLEECFYDVYNRIDGPDGFSYETVERIVREMMAEQNPCWISVDDKLPQSGYDVLICAEGNVFPGYYNTDTGKWHDENGNLVSGVTHWMIIPHAPEE